MLLAGSTSMGIAIAGMHYIGMTAMQVQASISYQPFLFILSVIIAIVVSLAAIKISTAFLGQGKQNQLAKAIAAVVMGAAVSAMHYTGMAAAEFTSDPSKFVDHLYNADNEFIAILVSLAAFVILGGTLLIVYGNTKRLSSSS